MAAKDGMLLLMSVFFIGGSLSGCVVNTLDEKHKIIKLRQEVQGQPITVDIVHGEHWSERMQAGPIIFNILPQIVIWAEDQDGRLIDTLYITGADGKGFRHAGKNEKGAAFYAECFPVWASRLQAAGKSLPSKKEPYPDTVTSATPMSGFSLETRLINAEKTSALFLEVNKSNDVNDQYTKENNDWAGQPSLIYEAVITQMQPGDEYQLKLIGHGGRIKDTPDIYTDLTGLDTAMEQIREITVKQGWGEAIQ
ncbi:hypothetical protein JW933_08990 [candidate division FCPU426 bacterium]|nr:hypothetical protein [candidate division FCPU426 bacterium]